MTEKPKYLRLPDDPCISNEVFFDYIDGKLSNADMHMVEKHLVNCEMCSDALEGLSRVHNRDKVAGGWKLPAKGADTGAKVISLWNRPSLYYSAAACALLLIGFFTMRNFVSGDRAMKTAELERTMSDSIRMPASAFIKADSASIRVKPDQPIADQMQNTQQANRSADKEQQSTASGMTSNSEAASGEGNASANDNSIMDIPQDGEERTNTSTDDLNTSTANTERDANNVITQNTNGAGNKKSKTRLDRSKDEAPATSANTQKPKANAAAGADASVPNKNAEQEVVLSNTVTNEDAQAPNFDYRNSENATADTVRSEVPYALKESDQDIELSYNKGIELLGQNKAEQSLVFFDEVLKFPKNIHFEDAQWKKSEALILLGRKTEAKELLNKIVAAGGKYKTQAQEKLKTL